MSNKNNSNVTNQKNHKSNRFLRIGDVVNLTGISKSYLYKLCKNGLFPKSVSLIPGGVSVAWVESEISSWMDGRITERDGGVS